MLPTNGECRLMVMSLVGKLMMSAARWLALPVLAGVIGFAIALQSQSGGDPASFSKEVSGSGVAFQHFSMTLPVMLRCDTPQI